MKHLVGVCVLHCHNCNTKSLGMSGSGAGAGEGGAASLKGLRLLTMDRGPDGYGFHMYTNKTLKVVPLHLHVRYNCTRFDYRVNMSSGCPLMVQLTLLDSYLETMSYVWME